MTEIGSDGVDEALTFRLRELFQAAKDTGHHMARLLRAFQAQIERSRAELREQYEEQRQAWEKDRDQARATVEPVHTPEWWSQASPEEIARVYEVMLTWREHDPEVARAEDVIHTEVEERYGIRLDTPPPEMVRDYLQKLEERRGDLGQETDPHADAPRSPDAERPTPREASYDATDTAGFETLERREQMVLDMRREGVPDELIEHRMWLDSLHDRPAAAAVEPRDEAEHERGLRRLRGRSRSRSAGHESGEKLER